jgi:formylglycine-generating enzyme
MKKALLIVCVVMGLGSVAMAVEIETVHVGNPGNIADTRYGTPGYGAVSYQYNIGKYEVTAGQYREFLNAVAGVDTYGLYNGDMWASDYGCKIERYAGSGTGSDPYQYRVDADWANRPVNFVSWGDSARFSNWLHNGQPTGTLTGDSTQDAELTEDGSYNLKGAMSDAALLAVDRKSDATWAITSEDEWYKAAYYSGSGIMYYDYPTSTNIVPSNDLVEPTDLGNNATFYVSDGDYTIGSPYYRTEFGAHENSESPYDTLDQGGNVWEWNETILYGAYRGVRGGSFYPNVIDMHASDWNGSFPALEDFNLGFRVTEVPEPATMAILTAGGLAMIQRRKRGMCK